MKLPGRLVLAVIAILASWPLVRGYHAARFEYNSFHLPRWRPPRPADAAALGLKDVQFASDAGATVRGWYLPSRTGAAMVFASGTGCDRTMLLEQARIVAAGGTGVLLFDWPGCGESDGRIGAGPAERAALRAAVTWLSARPEVQRGRVGVLGFSLGSWVALTAGADDPRVASFVLEGVYDDPRAQTMVEYERSGHVAQWGAVLGTLLGGTERPAVRASTRLAGIAPRPVAFVTGTADRSVPPAMTRALHAAAGEPKELWVIPDAVHGGYVLADSTFGPRLRAFVERTLAPAGAPTAR